MRPEDRERAQIEASTRVVDRIVACANESSDLEAVLNDTLYYEKRRLERAKKGDPRARADATFYAQLRRETSRASDVQLRNALDKIARRFAAEIVGNFNPTVYRASTTVVPAALSLLLSTTDTSKLTSWSGLHRGLADHVQVQGAIDHMRAVAKEGTLIVVPTHSSHLDSVVLGYAVHLLGMPPLLYGAGLNLFDNPVLSYFMNNLGAYRVDRRKKDRLYKDVLKEYASFALELGYNNLFFPGGTRSRDGSVERHLKKGLLGTGLSAYINNLRAERSKPKLFVVPCTISYKLVLEASTLIDDHLQEAGKSRYIIEDDEFSRPRRVLHFLRELVSLDARVILTFSPPIDLFGNAVDEAGQSLDPRGRPIDPQSYVMRNGEPTHDAQRDSQYTNEVAHQIASAYLRDNVLMSTHIVGRAVIDLLKELNPDMDFFRLLRTGGKAPSLTFEEVAKRADRLVETLVSLDPVPRFGDELERHDGAAIVEDALRHFACYHERPAIVRRGDRVFHEDRNLLYYYGNRLRGYDLGRKLN